MSSEGFDRSTIISSFLDEVGSYIPDIEASLDRLQVAPEDPEALEEAYRRTHTIGGSAAMMDFPGLARIAQGMETILDGALEQRAALDAPTVALLRRSCARMERSASAIRAGAPDTAIVAEDDQDHMAYRGPASSYGASPSPIPPNDAYQANGGYNANGFGGVNGSNGANGLPDWLAAFGGPGGDASRGSSYGDPAAQSNSMFGMSSTAPRPSGSAPLTPPAPGSWSNSLAGIATSASPAIPTQAPAFQPAPRANIPDENADFIQSQATAQLPAQPQLAPTAPPRWNPAPPAGMAPAGPTFTPPASPPQSAPLYGSAPLPPVAPIAPAAPSAPLAGPVIAQPNAGANDALNAMRVDEESVRRQALNLRETVEMLREAAQAMESERGQLQSFLDGSHDALERLETWVGQQMNLDLRNSPEAVRSYLPLSVIWVTTTRLKKLIALLTAAGRNLTVTQEQLDETLNEFHSSLETLSHMSGFYANAAQQPNGGFTATVAQFNWAPNTPSQSHPTVDALSVGQRADMERAVREELRRSLEDEVRQDLAVEMRSEVEQRIRQELEVQLRRQMTFSTLGVGMGESSVTVRGGALEVRAQTRSGRQTQVTTELSPEAQEVFREEAAEHLQTITTGISELERSPGDMQTIQSVRRATHTLKGAAGMMGFVVIQRLGHASEDLLDLLAEQGRGLTQDELGLLFQTAETLDQLINNVIVGDRNQREAAQALIDRYEIITGHHVESLLASAPGEAAEPTADDEAPAAAPQGSSEDLSVRLRLSKLDELVNLFGELLVNRSIYEERVGRLNRLVEDSTNASERLLDINNQLDRRFANFLIPSRQHPGGAGGLPALNMPNMPGSLPPLPRSGQMPFGNQQPTGPEHLRGFDAIEMDRYDEFHSLSSMLGEIVNDEVALSREMSNLIRELQVAFARETRLSSEVQDRLLKARLVPIRTLAPRLYRAARNSARREGKEVEFFIEGGDIEVDRKIVEEVEGPLLHLVRNSVNHGIEPPDVRQAAGKPRAGRIVVSAAYEGNQVLIEVQDDGRGIDPNRLRDTAVARGWVDAYTPLSDREALNLIFQPGVSTAESVTEESGRGVGLDVVRDAATRLKGSVEVESEVGAGALFSLRFPISLQIARAVLVKVGENTYAIPMAVVDQIGRLDYYERVTEPAPAVVVRGEQYTLLRLSALLKQPPQPVDERAPLLIVNAGRRRIALLVDGIVQQQEIVAKPLGAHLRNVRGVAGATALGNGQLVVILELLDLLATPTPIRDEIVLPEPGSGRRDTLPSTATPAISGPRSRVSLGPVPLPGAPIAPQTYAEPAAPQAYPTPSQPMTIPAASPLPMSSPIPQPAPIPTPPASWGSASSADATGFAAQAGRSSGGFPGFPPASGPSTPIPPFLRQGADGAPQMPPLPPSGGPSTPMPPFLRQDGPATPPSFPQPGPNTPPAFPRYGGPVSTPFVSDTESTTRLQPLSGQPNPGASSVGIPQRAPVTGSTRDFVVETENRRTVTALTSKPSYVLVVDDSPSVRTVVTGMLKANGWETQSSRDGIEALEAIHRKRPAAVLLDIEMPRMDGFELMATLRSDPQYRNLPLIVLTSRAADKHRLRAQQLGSNAYVVKPYKDQALLDTIASLVAQAQSGAI